MCKWFKHDVLAHRDKKLRALRAKHGHNGTGIYFHLLEVMGYDDDGYLPYDLNALSIELGLIKRKDREVLAEVISDFGLFEFTEDNGTRYFYSPRFVEQLEGISSASDNSSSKDTRETRDTIDSSPSHKRTYNLSEEGREKLKQTASNARKAKTQILESNPNNPRKAKEQILEDNPRNPREILEDNPKDLGGTIGGENKDIRIKTKENIDSVEYIDNNSTSKEIKAQKQKKANSEKFTRELKAVFGEYYKARTNSEFYWDSKQMTHIAKISAQLTAGMREKGIEPTSESVSANFRVLLGSIRNQWILDNLSPAIISSKFNEIRSQYANTHTAGVTGLDSGYDALRRAFAAGLVPDTGTA